jgi:MOSC domain-containing protein YiiM
MEGRIIQINISRGGVPKSPVQEAMLTFDGLSGDEQAHKSFHGGPRRALCLYSLELIRRLQSEGHPIYPGSIGENITTEGIDWEGIKPGVRLKMGDEVEIEISGYAPPCKAIAGSFAEGMFRRISQQENAGWSRVYARVINPGRMYVGQRVALVG